MYSNIYPILLGYNNNKLYGTKNDLYIIYNLFYNFYIKNDKNWFIPKIFYNEDLKLINIINYIKNLDIKNNSLIIIYFSGESNKKGYLKFYNEKINIIKLLKKINIKNINFYFIIDSCYSKIFFQNLKENFYYINSIRFIGSCVEYEKSKEVSNTYDPKLFNYLDIDHCDHIISIFTLYFCKIIIIKNYDIDDFNKLIDDGIFKMISNRFQQTIFYDEIFYI
jgi:hypothetical protein